MSKKYNEDTLVIADTQVRSEVNIDHIGNLGEWIARNRPKRIVHIGDHWDMPSLSSYDRGTAKIEGRRVLADIQAGNDAMRVLLDPLRRLQQHQAGCKKRIYRPEMHFFIGNHEERIKRYENSNPALQGFIGYDHFDLSDWIVHDFLDVGVIEGVAFAHYFYNPNSGRPYGGSAEHRLNKIKRSFVQGHEQGFKYHIEAVGKKRIHGLVVGSFYTHDESYKGPQGNDHWRGVALLRNHKDGEYDLKLMSVEEFL
ncbi:constituent protein [Pseudomonas phage PaP4]|uniref:Constituent protein n=1 Tax=Pseudomonas phage PaP4 TaxID=1273709 RepID=L7TIU9_9CAUD|nr:constituent protein [Pseudomonas phage PaP4]AGC35277.1 constituent protein [Pseudomonas phage PaP4]WFP47266.1 hypothetical protein FJK_gp45 [Pseudomonas phage FJK]